LQRYPDLDRIHHVHTAGNSPAMCDAAAVVLLGDAAFGASLGITPRARLLASTTACGEPLEVLSGCISATQKLLTENRLDVGAIDLFEIHEAFAATMIKARRELALGDDRLNANGGVIALGHPMGATGAIMTGTLLDEMQRQGLTRGVVAASGAAGSGSALLIAAGEN
jgi:acetyl-CoA C-acetyltransferase